MSGFRRSQRMVSVSGGLHARLHARSLATGLPVAYLLELAVADIAGPPDERSKHGRVMRRRHRCSACWETGHNARNCPVQYGGGRGR